MQWHQSREISEEIVYEVLQKVFLHPEEDEEKCQLEPIREHEVDNDHLINHGK